MRGFMYSVIVATLVAGSSVLSGQAATQGSTPFWLRGGPQFKGPFWMGQAKTHSASQAFQGQEGPQVFIGDTNTAVLLLSPAGMAEAARLARQGFNRNFPAGTDIERSRQFGSQFIPGPEGVLLPQAQGRGVGLGQQGSGTGIGPQSNEPLIGQQGTIAPTPQGSSLIVAPNGTFGVRRDGGSPNNFGNTPGQAGVNQTVGRQPGFAPTGRGAGH